MKHSQLNELNYFVEIQHYETKKWLLAAGFKYMDDAERYSETFAYSVLQAAKVQVPIRMIDFEGKVHRTFH